MDDKETKLALDQIMLRGAAMCGCALPNTDFFADFIACELEIFINQYGFTEFTLQEILTALRLNESQNLRFPSGLEIERVVFSGNCFNVAYISKVLGNYSVLRNMFDRKLQNHIDGY
jgi:hypothetical protein